MVLPPPPVRPATQLLPSFSTASKHGPHTNALQVESFHGFTSHFSVYRGLAHTPSFVDIFYTRASNGGGSSPKETAEGQTR